MKILLINHYAGSPHHGMEYRPYYLAREWRRLGHEVLIVAADYSHVRAVQPQLNKQNSLEETIDGINYVWYKTPRYSGNGIGRIRNIASFVAKLYIHGKELARSFKPDVVIASSTYPMDIWPANRIARIAKARLVYEVHDLWPLSPIELGGMSRRHPFIMLVQAAEDYAYRNSDLVISMLPKVKEYMESRGLAPGKLHLVPNGIDPGEWTKDRPELDDKPAAKLAELKAAGYTIVGYAGAHGIANALATLIDAAKLMRNEKTAFVLVGKGLEKAGLCDAAQKEGLDNVHFFDPVAKKQIPGLLQYFDIAFIGLQRQPLFRFGIAPNKLMDYMMAGRPVLMAIDAGNDLVSQAGCGITVKPEDPEEIVRGVRHLLSFDSKERKAMGQKGHEFVMAHHAYPMLAERFIEICK